MRVLKRRERTRLWSNGIMVNREARERAEVYEGGWNVEFV
jgi:hypothetical protein